MSIVLFGKYKGRPVEEMAASLWTGTTGRLIVTGTGGTCTIASCFAGCTSFVTLVTGTAADSGSRPSSSQ